MVAFYLPDTKIINCAGTLINDRYILTAAHCIVTEHLQPLWNFYEYYLAGHGTKNISSTGIKVEIEYGIVHPEYSYNDYDRNDIGLIKLKKPIQFTDKVSSLCLPNNLLANGNPMDRVSHKPLRAVGWGAQKFKDYNSTPEALSEVDIQYLDLDECINHYWVPEDSTPMVVSTNMCAFSPGKDTCQGDSGGPLTTFHRGRHFQLGITSWAMYCAVDPGIYTRVASYLDWIEQNTRDATYCMPQISQNYRKNLARKG